METIKKKIYKSKGEQEKLSFLRQFSLVTKEMIRESDYYKYLDKRKVWINKKPGKNDRFARFFYFEERDYSQLNMLLNDIYTKIIKLRKSPSAKEGMDKVEEIMRGAIYKVDKDANSDCFKVNQLYKKLSQKYVKHIYEYYLKNEFNAEECRKKWAEAYEEIVNDERMKDISHSVKKNFITFNTAFQFVFEYAYAHKLTGESITPREWINFVYNTYSLSTGGGEYPSYRNATAYITKANWTAVSEENIKEGMDQWASWISGEEVKRYNPIELACISHCVLVQMQAFPDGNHRLARLVANEILIQNDMPPVYVAFDRREEYHKATNKAIETHDLDDLLTMYYGLVFENAKEVNRCLDRLIEKQSKEREL